MAKLVQITLETLHKKDTLILSSNETEAIDLSKVYPKLIKDINDIAVDYGFKVSESH